MSTACLVLLTPMVTSAATVKWVGASGSFWDLAANWNPALPGSADDVVLTTFDTVFRQNTVSVHTFNGTGKLTVTGGSLSVAGTSSIGALVLTGGSLSGAGALTAGSLSFSGGTLGYTGGGKASINGSATFDGTGSQSIANGYRLNLKGNSAWTAGNGRLFSSYDSGVLTISGGTTFADAGAAAGTGTKTLGGSAPGYATLANFGTYVRSGLGTTQVNASLNNTGGVKANAGQLYFGGGGSSSGDITIASGATLGFNGGSAFNLTGGTLTNGGTVLVDAGYYGSVLVSSGSVWAGSGGLSVASGTLQFLRGSSWAPTTLSVSGGAVTGPGTVNAGTLAFSGGSFGSTSNAPGTTNVAGGATFDGTAALGLAGNYALNLNGNATWTTGNGSIFGYYDNGTLSIASGTTFTDTGAAATTNTKTLGGGRGDSSVLNAGAYVRNGLGTTQINANFTNTGSLKANAGQTYFGGGGTSNGAIAVASGATLGFNGGSFNINSGTVTNNGTVLANAGSYGSVLVSAGSTLAGSGVVSVTSGNLEFLRGSMWSPASLSVSGGSLTGPGIVNAGTLAFSGGSFGSDSIAPGTTNVAGAASFDGTGSLGLAGNYAVNLNGNATWTTGNGSIFGYYDNGTLSIASGTTFTDTGAAAATTTKTLGGGQGHSTVLNAGTYARNGLGTTQVQANFSNTGTIKANAGQLYFSGGGTSSGAIGVASGATLGFNGSSGVFNITGGIVTNNGTLLANAGYYGSVLVSAGSTLAGSGLLSVASGNLEFLRGANWSPASLIVSGGSVTGPGTVNAGTLAFSGGSFGSDSIAPGTTNVAGAASFDGTGSLGLAGNYAVNLNGNATWTTGNGSIFGYYDNGTLSIASGTTFTDTGAAAATTTKTLGGGQGHSTVLNAGTYARNGLGTTQVQANFSNTGTIKANAGQLYFSGGGTSSGAIGVASGATLGFNGSSGVFNVTGGIVTNNGTLLANAGYYGSVLVSAGSTLAGSGLLSVASGNLEFLKGSSWSPTALNVSGGYVTGPGTVNAGTLDFSGGAFGSTSISPGTTNVSGLATIDGTANLGLAGNYSLNLNGSASWTTGNGSIFGYSDSGTLAIGSGATFTDSGSAASTNTKTLGGSAGNSTVLIAGTYVRNGLGTTQVNGAFIDNGNVQVNAGKMAFSGGFQGEGKLQINAAGALAVSGYNSSIGTLVHNGGAGALALDTHTITVTKDYTNANWGSGDSFNRLANITTTGTGQHILAAGDVTQAVATGSFAGASIANGATDTPTLTIGNVHVGSQTVSFNVANTGTTGPALRGALQPGVNGGNITDSRLTGFNNWGPAAVGGTAAATFSFNVASAGVYTPIASGQTLAVVNNFENTNSQVLSVKSSAGAAAYNLAAATVTPSSNTLAAQRIGGTLGSTVTIKNTAPAGSYTEKLDAAFGANSGGAANNGASVSLIAVNGTSTALQVRVDTSTAGAKSGTATVLLTSDGSGTSGLGLTSIASQKVSVSGAVYGTAIAKLNTPTIDFGIVHKGDSVAARSVSIGNAAPVVSGYNDSLLGSISGSGSTFTSTGKLTGVAAGATDASSLHVALNTATAGSFSGTSTIALSSHDSVLTDLTLASSTVALKAQVNNFASDAFGKVSGSGTFSGSGASYTLNFGTLKSGAAAVTANLSVLNTATGFADLLGGSFLTGKIGTGDDFALAGFGASFSGIAAGSSYTGLSVKFGGTTLGKFDEVVTLKGIGSNASGYSGALADLQLHLVGTVNSTGTAALDAADDSLYAAVPETAGAVPELAAVLAGVASADFRAAGTAVTAVPEPSTYVLTLQGLLATVWMRRRRRATRAA